MDFAGWTALLQSLGTGHLGTSPRTETDLGRRSPSTPCWPLSPFGTLPELEKQHLKKPVSSWSTWSVSVPFPALQPSPAWESAGAPSSPLPLPATACSARLPTLGVCTSTLLWVPAWHGAAEGCGLHLSLSKQHIVLQQQSPGPVVQVPLVVTLDFSWGTRQGPWGTGYPHKCSGDMDWAYVWVQSDSFGLCLGDVYHLHTP